MGYLEKYTPFDRNLFGYSKKKKIAKNKKKLFFLWRKRIIKVDRQTFPLCIRESQKKINKNKIKINS